MFKHMKLGTKIAFGFGSLVIIAAALGSLAVWNMWAVQAESTVLANEYVPEVELANEVERNSLMTMYAMRGYGLSEEQHYYDTGMEYLGKVEQFLQECKDLAGRATRLKRLGPLADEATSKANQYKRLVADTVATFEKMSNNRANLDTSAATYMTNCANFLESQNKAFEDDLADRQEKIRLVTEIVNLGTKVRVLNFKSQATNDPEMMQQAIDTLATLNQFTDPLRKISHDDEDIRRINDTEAAAKGYRQAMTNFLAEFNKGENASSSVMSEHRAAMDENAGTYVQNCTEFLAGQQRKLSEDLGERHRKITLVNDIIDLGNATRILCFKSQTLRDPELMRQGDATLQKTGSLFDELKSITRSPTNLEQIERTREAGETYRTAMNNFLNNWIELQNLNKSRTEAGDAVLAAAKETALAGVDGTKRIANDAVTALNTASNVMIVGLIIAGAIGVCLALVITRGITKAINRIIENLDSGANQVNEASGQVSSASQQLAEGASEQASSLEETSSALEQMAAMTRTNAENAKKANDLSGQAQEAAAAGDKTMARLNDAMTAINESSGQISKIIKVIEEIAFQTNLLALNAAVEAARAGEHGKGFAVVADEVRNLAQRAAQAARETTDLIEASVVRAKEGTDVADEVGKGLTKIVEDVTSVSELINGISKASEEQAQGVEQVNTAVSQMDKVTQQNAANAEESASAAEELSAQAQTVKAQVDELVAMVRGRGSRAEQGRSSTSSAGQSRSRSQSTGQHYSQPTHQQEPVGAGSSYADSSENDDGLSQF